MQERVVNPGLVAIGAVNEVAAIRLCGQYVCVAECWNCSTRHFAGFNKCRSRWCLPCQKVRSLLWLMKLFPVLYAEVMRGSYLNLFTFTYRDQDDLFFMEKIMEKAWRSMFMDKSFRKIFKKRFVGWVRAVEVKLGDGSGIWHVHYHVLLVSREYGRDSDWIISAWKHFTDGEGSVDVKSVKLKDPRKSLVKVILETVKYPFKFPLDVCRQVEKLDAAYEVLKDKRMISTGGVLRNLGVKDEEMSQWEEKKLERFVCSLCGCTQAELRSILYDSIKNDFLYDVKGFLVE